MPMFAINVLKSLISVLDEHSSLNDSITDYACGDVAFCTLVDDHLINLINDKDFEYITALEESSKSLFLRDGGYGDNARDEAIGKKTFRGDKICFLTPSLCKEHHPNLLHFQKLVLLIVKGINIYHKLHPGELAEDEQLDFSAQLAVFPGNGSRYVRHMDVSKTGRVGCRRKITVICYLNRSWNGGQLRVYAPSTGSENTPVSEYLDIDPKLGRVVVFKSDSIEHEVLPCHSRRTAITVWASTPEASCRISVPRAIAASNYHGRIFVSIANYRDSEAPLTARDLFAKALHPDKIFIGTVFQGCDITDDDCAITSADCPPGHLRSVRMHHSEARGPCYARHIAESLWQGEEFFLQIDSHMRFEYGWDEYLVTTLCNLEQAALAVGEQVKPVLTTYPQGYALPNLLPAIIRPTVLVPTSFNHDCMLRQSARTVQLSSVSSSGMKPERSCAACRLALQSPLWAAGFSFSRSNLLIEVPYDPLLPHLFFGEEAVMAARLFTHGYSFFAPLKSVIFHLYSRAHRPTSLPLLLTTDSNDLAQNHNAKKSFSTSIAALQSRSRALSQLRVRFILSSLSTSSISSPSAKNNILNGLDADEIRELSLHCRRGERFGLGLARTLEDFEQSCGVRFSDMEIQQRNWEQSVSQCGVCKSASIRSCSFVQDISASAIVPSEETGSSGSGSEGVGVLTELLNDMRSSGISSGDDNLKTLDIIRQFLG